VSWGLAVPLESLRTAEIPVMLVMLVQRSVDWGVEVLVKGLLTTEAPIALVALVHWLHRRGGFRSSSSRSFLIRQHSSPILSRGRSASKWTIWTAIPRRIGWVGRPSKTGGCSARLKCTKSEQSRPKERDGSSLVGSAASTHRAVPPHFRSTV